MKWSWLQESPQKMYSIQTEPPMAESKDTKTSLVSDEKQNETLVGREKDAVEALLEAFEGFKKDREESRRLKLENPEAYAKRVADALMSVAKRATPWKEGELQKGLIITNMLPPPSSQDT